MKNFLNLRCKGCSAYSMTFVLVAAPDRLQSEFVLTVLCGYRGLPDSQKASLDSEGGLAHGFVGRRQAFRIVQLQIHLVQLDVRSQLQSWGCCFVSPLEEVRHGIW